MNTEDFILKSLMTLQKQIDRLEKQLETLEIQVRNIEDQIQWNMMYGDFIKPPREMVVRLANGNLALNINEEVIFNDTTD